MNAFKKAKQLTFEVSLDAKAVCQQASVMGLFLFCEQHPLIGRCGGDDDPDEDAEDDVTAIMRGVALLIGLSWGEVAGSSSPAGLAVAGPEVAATVPEVSLASLK